MELFEMWGTIFGGLILVAIATVQTVRAGIAKRVASDALQAATVAHQKVESVSAASVSDLSKSNADLASAYKMQSEEWKALVEKTYKEQQDYRNWVHEKAKEDNALMLRLTAENADLKARTDLTPILEYMKRSDDHAEKVSKSLEGLTETIRLLIQHVAPNISTNV